MSKDRIFYNPEMLIWARLNEGFDKEDAIKRINEVALEDIETEYGLTKPLDKLDLRMYEEGAAVASIDMLKLFAKAYKRQLAVFMLSKPPKEDRRVLAAVRLVYHDGSDELHEFKED